MSRIARKRSTCLGWASRWPFFLTIHSKKKRVLHCHPRVGCTKTFFGIKLLIRAATGGLTGKYKWRNERLARTPPPSDSPSFPFRIKFLFLRDWFNMESGGLNQHFHSVVLSVTPCMQGRCNDTLPFENPIEKAFQLGSHSINPLA